MSITTAHAAFTTLEVANRFNELAQQGLGRIDVDQIMLYEVRDGKIVMEQFFY